MKTSKEERELHKAIDVYWKAEDIAIGLERMVSDVIELSHDIQCKYLFFETNCTCGLSDHVKDIQAFAKLARKHADCLYAAAKKHCNGKEI